MKGENFIVKLSEFFVKNIRFTLLLLIAIFFLGIASYTQLLKREGFPPVQFPVILISGNYIVNNKELLSNQVTKPIEQEVSKLIEVKEVNSVTTDNTFQISIVLFENANSEDVNQKILNNIEKLRLPEGVKYSTFIPNPSKFENEFDILVSLYSKNNITPEELQQKAEVLTNDLLKSPDIVQAKVIPLIQERTNPISGQKISFLERQNFITIRENNELKNYNSILVGVAKNEAMDLLKFSDSVNKKITELSNQDKYKDFGLIVTSDFAPTIKEQIGSLEQSTIISLLIIILIISFVINIKSALIIGFAVILVLASTMTGLLFTGNTLNVISLFALILVLGMFVDDAIVVVEAIAKQRAKYLDRFSAIKEAIKEVGVPKIAGSITTILVFVPMFFITGVLGNFIRLIPTTVIMTLVISLLASLTVIAAITVFILKKPQKKNVKYKVIGKLILAINQLLSWENPLISVFANQVSKFTSWYLNNKLRVALVVLISLVLVFTGVSFAQRLEFNIFPESEDADNLVINISNNELIPQTDPNLQTQIINNLYQDVILTYQKYIDRISWEIRGQVIVGSLTLTQQRDKNSKEIARFIEQKIKETYPSLIVNVSVFGGGGPRSDKYPFKMQIFLEDQQKLEKISNLAKEILENELSYTNKKSEKINVTEVIINNLNTISKTDMRRFASIEAKFDKKVDDSDIRNIQNIVKSNLSEKIKSDYNLNPDEIIGTKLGQQEGFLESFNSAIVAFFVSLIAMYAYLVLQYNSFTLPLLVYTAIPFTFPLLFPGLYLIDSPLSFFIMLGLITLSGVVVNNSIIFVDYANSLIKSHNSHNLKAAATQTIKERFRPILATSLTTIFGLLPVAIADPFWRGLASGIMFGLLSSTILVILAFPAYYYVFQGIRSWLKRRIFH